MRSTRFFLSDGLNIIFLFFTPLNALKTRQNRGVSFRKISENLSLGLLVSSSAPLNMFYFWKTVFARGMYLFTLGILYYFLLLLYIIVFILIAPKKSALIVAKTVLIVAKTVCYYGKNSVCRFRIMAKTVLIVAFVVISAIIW